MKPLSVTCSEKVAGMKPIANDLKEAHTPGPWIYKHDENGTRISPKWGQFRLASLESCSDGEREANAKLIAAAPELKEALQAIIDECPNPKLPYGKRVVEIARSVLAKTTH